MKRQICSGIILVVVAFSINNAQAQTTPASADASGRNEMDHLQLFAAPADRRYRAAGFNFSLTSASRRFAKVSKPSFNIAPTSMVSGPSMPVFGGGTLGRLTKWTGFTSSDSIVGDSNIFEDKYGKVGIGTTTPSSSLTVAGIVESSSGGFKFPDGSVQTSSAAGALFSVIHDATLAGAGTSASPLQVASPLEIRDLDNPARQPFQAGSSCSTTSDGCFGSFITVPAGKRLVIEYMSMLADIPAGQVALWQVRTTVGGQHVHFLPQSAPAVAGFIGSPGVAAVSQQVRLYADPGSVLILSFTRNGTGTQAHFDATISGYLVDTP